MTLEKLPMDWEMKNIGDVTRNSKYGCNPESTGNSVDGISFLRITDLKGGRGIENPLPQNAKFENQEDIEKYTLTEGDFVIARSGSIGQSYVYEPDDGEMVYASYLIKFQLKTDILLPKYVRLFLQSPLFWNQVNEAGRGGTQQNINAGQIKDFDIPVPPLEEQERIVNEVEDRLETIRTLEKSLKNLDQLTEEQRDSTFAYILSGVNAEEVKNQVNLPTQEVVPDKWDVYELNEIADRLRSTYETEDGVLYDLYSFDAVDSGEGFFVTDGSEINSRKRELFGGEVLISRLNPRISRVCKVDEESDNKPVASTEFVALNLTSDEISREFLYQYLKTPLIREYLTNQTTGSTGSHSRVSFDEIMSLPVPIPPRKQQEEIIEQLSTVESNTETVEKSVEIVDQYIDEYKRSVLHHSFSGELV